MRTDKSMDREQILTAYYGDNARKLHRTVDRILLKFGGGSERDPEDFYSLANEVFVDAIKRYDESQNFDTFLYSCLLNKIKSEMTKRSREKRRADRMTVSIDMPVGEGEETTIGDMIADSVTVEQVLFEGNEESYSKRMLLYLDRLSNLQREVLRRNAAGYLPDEIRKDLHISKKEYVDCKTAIRSYRNVSVLF